MNCDRIRELLSPHLDDALHDGEREAVRDHLESCPDCREHFESLAQVVSLIRGIPAVAAPEQFREGVVTALPTRGRQRGVLLQFIPAAAAAILLVCFGYLGARHVLPEQVTPEVGVGMLGPDSHGPEKVSVEGSVTRDRADDDLVAASRSALPSAPMDSSPGAVGTGAVGIGGGAGGALRAATATESVSSKPGQVHAQRSLSYVVSGGEPDATAGLILAELQNRRSRSPRPELGEAADDKGTPAGHERVVSDAQGEPARLVLYLTADEVRYILTLLADRKKDTGVMRRLAKGDRVAVPPPASGPAGAKAKPQPADVSGPRAPMAETECPPEDDPAADRDKFAHPEHRFRVELRFDR